MPAQYEIRSCPFCGKGEIKCLYFPSVRSEKVERSATFGSKTRKTKTSEVWLPQSDCPSCGKSGKEIEKELRKGTVEDISKESDSEKQKKRLEELKKLGFSGVLR